MCVCVCASVTASFGGRPACLLCCCSYRKAVVTGIVMGSLHTMDGECKGITVLSCTCTVMCSNTHRNGTHSTEHFLGQACSGSSALHGNVRKYSHHIWHSWAGAMGPLKHTHTHTITNTNQALMLIPSPPAVIIILPSNPYRLAQSSVSAGFLKRTCKLLVQSYDVSALKPPHIPSSSRNDHDCMIGLWSP